MWLVIIVGGAIIVIIITYSKHNDIVIGGVVCYNSGWGYYGNNRGQLPLGIG